jgi:enoyl-CoA hydratase/carnithine racemase
MGSAYRVAFKNSLFAMPETAIGFFPDVGATYFLQKIWQPAYGKLAALSGVRFTGTDAVHVGCASHLVRSEDFMRILHELENAEWTGSREENHLLVKRLLDDFHAEEPSSLMEIDEIVENIFSQSTFEEVTSAWQEASEKSAWLRQAWQSFEKGSPLSRKLIWRQLQQDWSRSEAAIREWDMAIQLCKDSDFREGVRAVLIDKDKNPQWKHSSPEEVCDQEVEVLLTPLKENPLLNYFSATT